MSNKTKMNFMLISLLLIGIIFISGCVSPSGNVLKDKTITTSTTTSSPISTSSIISTTTIMTIPSTTTSTTIQTTTTLPLTTTMTLSPTTSTTTSSTITTTTTTIQELETVFVSKVIDGDTVMLYRDLKGSRYVRMPNVNAPERKRMGWLKERERIKRMIEGKTVTIRPKGRSYGRIMGEIVYKRKLVR